MKNRTSFWLAAGALVALMIVFAALLNPAPSSGASSGPQDQAGVMQATEEATVEATEEVVPTAEATEEAVPTEGIGIPVSNEQWELTVNGISFAMDVQSVMMETVTPEDPSQAFFLVPVTLSNLAFDEAATLPEADSEAGDQLLSGVPFYAADPELEAGAFALADVLLTDAEGNEYPVAGVAVGEGEEFLVAENLTDFFVGLPEETQDLTFVFAAPGMLTADASQLTFQLGDLAVPLVEGVAAEGGPLELGELTQTLEAGDGFTLMLPEGWVTFEDPSGMGITLFGPSMEVLSSQTMDPGNMAVAFMGPSTMQMVPPGTSFEEVLTLVAGMMGTDVQGATTEAVTVGAYEGAVISVAQQGVAISILGLELGDDQRAVLVAFGHESQGEEVEAALLSIGETLAVAEAE